MKIGKKGIPPELIITHGHTTKVRKAFQRYADAAIKKHKFGEIAGGSAVLSVLGGVICGLSAIKINEQIFDDNLATVAGLGSVIYMFRAFINFNKYLNAYLEKHNAAEDLKNLVDNKKFIIRLNKYREKKGLGKIDVKGYLHKLSRYV